MKHILQMLLYENGGLSLTRVIAVIFVLLFVGVTIFLVCFDMTWGHFETLAAMATGGGPAPPRLPAFSLPFGIPLGNIPTF